MSNTRKILYFAYDINMLPRRIKGCVYKGVVNRGLARIQDYELLFGHFSNLWYGRLLTISPAKGKIVYGTLWEFDECHKPKLDRAQGVSAAIYEPFEINVLTEKVRGDLSALTYRLVNPEHPKYKYGQLMLRYRPSKLYHDELVEGATDSCLPLFYRKFLKSFPHNGFTGSVLPKWTDEEK